MSKRSTHAREHQTSESPPAAKPACKQHSPWQQWHDHRIRQKHTLSAPTNNIALYVINRCQMNTAQSWTIAHKQIVDETGYSLSTVKRSTADLAKRKLIPRENKGRGRSHIYRYTLPPDFSVIPVETYEKVSEGHPLAEKGVRETPEKVSERHPVVEEVDLGWKEDIDPSIQQLSEAEVSLNRRILSHPDLGKIGKSQIEKLAAAAKTQHLFPTCCHYIHDPTAEGTGALVYRIRNPDEWPAPAINGASGSQFYWDFVEEVDALEAADDPGSFEPIEEPPPEIHDEPPAPRQPAARMPALPPRDMDPMQQIAVLDAIQAAIPTNGAEHDLQDRARERRKEITRNRRELDQETPEAERPKPETTAPDEKRLEAIAGEAEADVGQVEAKPDSPQPDARLIERLSQLLDGQTAEEKDRIENDLQKEVEAIQAKPLERADAQKRINEAVFAYIRALEAAQDAIETTEPAEQAPPASEKSDADLRAGEESLKQARLQHEQRRQNADRKERLRELLSEKTPQESDAIVLNLQKQIRALKAEQLPDDEAEHRYNQLLDDHIAILELEANQTAIETDDDPPNTPADSRHPQTDETEAEHTLKKARLEHGKRRQSKEPQQIGNILPFTNGSQGPLLPAGQPSPQTQPLTQGAPQ